MRVIAFLDVLGAEFDFADLAVPGLAGDRTDFELAALDGHHVEIVQVNGVARVGDDCAHVAGQKIFVFAHAEHERTATARADDKIRNVGVNQRDSVSADHLLQRRSHGVDQARFLLIDIDRGRARVV